ncbi:farnesol dehydrogenase-like [Cylas formicarius]|uniref:farnesol dehydrogenase-like n=1 Tax=Cylas formicarius TaxID=197179 RepID=UPI002958B696|nr:farnesol dehydrogenase-like [Cylas formicarius]
MVLSMDRWVGKVAVVTGTSAGIGSAIAELLVKRGLVVAGLARRKERTEKLAAELTGEKGKLHAVRCDVTKEEDVVEAFAWVRDNLGPIHVLVNNAGLEQATDLIDGDTEKWKKVLDTNILGLCIATREAVRDMTANGVDGHVININSIIGHKVFYFPKVNMYPATKFAVTALAETLRHEINRNNLKIKITSLSPGFVTSELMNASYGREVALADLNMDFDPFLNPDDIAHAVEYALSTPPHVQVSEITVRPVGERF